MKKTGTREWSDVSINCCLGCANACVYCYARQMALRAGRIRSGRDWAKERPRSLEEIARRPEYGRKHRGVVMLPTSHDVTPGNREACLAVLGRLLAAGNRVLLVTKPRLEIMADVGALYQGRLVNWAVCGLGLGDCIGPRLEVRCSITCLDDDIRREWEPAAPEIQERIEVLRYLRGEGIATSVAIEPNLQPDRVDRLVEIVDPLVSGTIWVGKLNKMAERLKWALDPQEGLCLDDRATLSKAADWLEAQQTDRKVMEVVEQLRGNAKIRWKDSYAEVVERSDGN